MPYINILLNMKKLSFKQFFYFVLIAFVVTSCIPARQYEEMKTKRTQCEDELKELKTANKDLTVKNTELTERYDQITRQIEGLKSDTSILGVTSRRLRDNYDQLNKTYNLLLEKNRELLEGSSKETKNVLSELQKTQEDLQKKEDELKKTEAEMNEKMKNLDELSKQLNATQASMQEKEMKLKELQNILNKQDAAVKALRETVSNALLGFENQGLTINIKNGKVYVSLEESLLFASGKFDVDAKGVTALKKLAAVLEKDPEINVLIEGHTDNVPYKGAQQIKDNWDLSVMRATAIVKILLENGKIAPERLSASGRSEFVPVDTADTKEAKAKNRRTEIILTPKLDKLFQIIESN